MLAKKIENRKKKMRYLVFAVLPLFFLPRLVNAEVNSKEVDGLPNLICQSLATPYEKKQDQLRAKNAKLFKNANQLIKEKKNAEARVVLQEMLALEGRNKLTTRESQFALFYMSNSYRAEKKPANAADSVIEMFHREGQIQPCKWETCSLVVVSLGEQYKSMGNYKSAKTVLGVVDQCAESFTSNAISKANLRLYQIASEQGDVSEIQKRGAWLLERNSVNPILTPELTAQISEMVGEASGSSFGDHMIRSEKLKPAITTEELCLSLRTPYEKKKDSQLRNKTYKSLVEAMNLIDMGGLEEARGLLAEMLAAKGWGKKLTTAETQYVFGTYAITYNKENSSDAALDWYSKIYRLDGEVQPCIGSSQCVGLVSTTGSFLKGQLKYSDAREWLQTVDQCPSVFSEKTKIGMIEDLFDIAVATDDVQDTTERGNWLLERASQSPHIDEELQQRIRGIIVPSE